MNMRISKGARTRLLKERNHTQGAPTQEEYAADPRSTDDAPAW
jgi:hypothetical protein